MTISKLNDFPINNNYNVLKICLAKFAIDLLKLAGMTGHYHEH